MYCKNMKFLNREEQMIKHQKMEERLLIHGSREIPNEASSVTSAFVLSMAVMALTSVAFGFSAGYSSPAQSGIMNDLGLSIAEYSAFGSILTFGGAIGAVVSGTITDIVGRRITMLIVDMLFMLGWILILLAKNVWSLDIGRFLIGVGTGFLNYVVPVYLAEISPKNIRGGATAAVMFFTPCALTLMFFMGTFFTWRTLALIGIIPSLLKALGTVFIPESPRWLAKIGLDQKAKAALQSLRGENADISLEAAEIKDEIETLRQQSESRFLDLFNLRYAYPVILGTGLMLLLQFGGSNGISSFANSIFERAGCSAGFATTLMGASQLPCAALSILLLDTCGRRPLLLVTSAGSFIGMCLTALGFLFQGYDQLNKFTPYLVLIGILVYSTVYSLAGFIPMIIMSEILPMNIKGSAGSLMLVTSWLSSTIVTYTFNFLFQWSSSGVFFIYAIFCGSTTIFAAMFLPETKGRTLEEIHASMRLDQ